MAMVNLMMQMMLVMMLTHDDDHPYHCYDDLPMGNLPQSVMVMLISALTEMTIMMQMYPIDYRYYDYDHCY
jgi:hypothetical protein